MKICFVAALLWVPPLAWAQSPPPDPANPDATVPRVAYRSVFADTPTGVEAESTDWVKANAEVGQFRRGHIDLLKWEEEQARSISGTPPGATTPAPGPHQHHGGKP